MNSLGDPHVIPGATTLKTESPFSSWGVFQKIPENIEVVDKFCRVGGRGVAKNVIDFAVFRTG